MALTENQIKLLQGIRSKMVRGDIKEIADKTGKAREYVSRVLSLSTDTYYEEIVNEAVQIIADREHKTKILLEKVIA